MPIVAIAGAVFAGVEISTVGLAAMSAFEVVGAVGAIASGVGAITGNDALMKIGGLASLAGGIGGIASGKGFFGIGGDSASAAGASPMVGDSASAASSGADAGAAADAASPASSGAGGMINTPDATSAASSAPLAAGAGNNPSAFVPPAVPTTPSIASPMGTDPVAAASALPSNTLTPGAQPGAQPGFTFNAAQDSQAAYTNGSAYINPAAAASGSPIMDAFGKFGSWVKDNKELASMGQNFVGGFFDKNKQAQTNLYDARTANEVLDTDIKRQQQLNAKTMPNMASLSVSGQNIFPGQPPTYSAPQMAPGLINSGR